MLLLEEQSINRQQLLDVAMALLEKGRVLKRRMLTSKLLENAEKVHERCGQGSEK